MKNELWKKTEHFEPKRRQTQEKKRDLFPDSAYYNSRRRCGNAQSTPFRHIFFFFYMFGDSEYVLFSIKI
jgi:hypothetical protein